MKIIVLIGSEVRCLIFILIRLVQYNMRGALLILLICASGALASSPAANALARINYYYDTNFPGICSEQFVSIDLKTGDVTPIMETFVYGAGIVNLVSPTVIDSNGVVYYTPGGDPFVTSINRANLKTKSVLPSIAFYNQGGTGGIGQYLYDPKKQQIIVLGSAAQGTVLATLSTTDPAAELQLWNVLGSGVGYVACDLDSENQLFYWIQANSLADLSFSLCWVDISIPNQRKQSIPLKCSNPSQLSILWIAYNSEKTILNFVGLYGSSGNSVGQIAVGQFDTTGRCTYVVANDLNPNLLEGSLWTIDAVGNRVYGMLPANAPMTQYPELVTLDGTSGALLNSINLTEINSVTQIVGFNLF